MSIGPDLKEVLSDVGTSYKIIRDSGDITGEYLDFETNAQVTKPFIKEFFLDAVLSYDTVAVFGDIIEFTVSGDRYLIMNKTPEMFENQIISYGAVLYKTNIRVVIYRPSESDWIRPDYKLLTHWTPIDTIDALLTTPLFGSSLDLEELGLLGMKSGEMYIPSSAGVRALDRIWIDSSEYYLVETVKKRRFPGVDVLDLDNDTRSTETTSTTSTTTSSTSSTISTTSSTSSTISTTSSTISTTSSTSTSTNTTITTTTAPPLLSEFTQTYLGDNRTYIGDDGLLHIAPVHTPVIDYVNGEPYVRLEPAAANLLFSSRTFTAAAGWTLSNATTAKDAVGIDGVANSGTTVTDASANYGKFIRGISKSASDSTTYFLNSIYVKKVTSTSAYPILEVSFIDVSTKYAQCIINHITGVLTANPANAAANASFTIEDKGLWWKVSASATDNGANTTAAFSLYPAGSSDGTTLSATAQGSCVIDAAMLTTGSIPSSYFDGAAAIGSELVTDGTFDVVTTGEALSSGLLTIGNCYKIATRTDGDFVAAGAPDNNVGTYFNATTTGAGLLDAGDTANPITFTNWTAGAGWAPQATAGALTGKAQKIAGTSSTFWQNGVVSADSVFRFGTVATVSAGTCYFYSYGQSVGTTINVSGTFTDYKIIPTSIPNTRAGFIADAAFVGTIDNFSVKEHGTVRLSEANTTTLAIPAAVAAILAAGTGTIVIKGRFAFARAAGVVTAILSSQNATASLAYTTTAAGNLSSFDATTVAESTGAYAANVDWKIAITFPSSAGKYRIGVDADGAGIVQGAEVAFDGDFTTGVNLILGRVLHGATWIEWIEIFDEVITDAQIDGM